MTVTRIVPLAMLLAVGCGGGSTAPKAREPEGKPNTSAAPAKDDPAAGTAAREFLAALAAGKADPGQLTPAFKAVVAGAGKDPGLTDWAAGQWLKGLAGKVTAAVTVAAVNPDTAVVTADPPAGGQAGRAVLRMTRAGGRWRVDWVHVAPPGPGVALTGTGDQLAAAFAAAAFIDTALTGQPRLAEAVLSTAAKSRLAPPLGGQTGYNQTVLGLKLGNFRGDATGYRVETQTADRVAGVLTGGSAGRPFTVKLARGANPGEWLVDDFQPN